MATLVRAGVGESRCCSIVQAAAATSVESRPPTRASRRAIIGGLSGAATWRRRSRLDSSISLTTDNSSGQVWTSGASQEGTQNPPCANARGG